MADRSDDETGRKKGGQPGNRNALKHGFYASAFKAEEAADLDAVTGEVDLSGEIAMMRVVIRRVFERVDQAGDLEDWAIALGALGGAATRLAGLLRTQKLLAGQGSDITEALSQALREVTSEIGSR